MTMTTDVSVWPSAFVVMTWEDEVVAWGGFVGCWLVVVGVVWLVGWLVDVAVWVGVVWVFVLVFVLVLAVLVV